jgi:multidrug efflux pump subunit AcrA (membrane-fusion protein)
MNFKKFALRGLIIVAVAVALCILFSGTIRTLTTPKVRFAQAKMGKFESVTELTGKVVFPEKEEVSIVIPEGLSLTVSRVAAEPGKRVGAGEKLLTTVVTDADKTLASLQQEIDTERETLDAWERKNGAIRLSRNEQLWVDAGIAAKEAEKTERLARLNLLSLLEPLGLTEVPEALPVEADGEISEAYTAWQETAAALEEARKAQARLDRYALSEDVWNLMKQKQEAQQKLADAEDRMMQIMLLQRKAAVITAPHDGYIIEVNVEKDAVLSGGTVLMTITPEKQQPVIRSELPDLTTSVQKGAALTIPSDSWGYAETRVINTGMSSTGHPFIDAEINEDVIYSIGDVSSIMKEDIKLNLTSRARESTCLLPASAVRGSGDGRYVYVGETESSALSGTRITVQKVSVTVVSESASTVSIAEDMSWYKVLYMEDRVINEGDTVMLYEE